MKAYKSILCVALCSIALAAAADDASNPCVNVPGAEYISDRVSCDGWIYCKNGVKFAAGKCTTGNRFDTHNGYCDEAANVECELEDMCNESNDGKYIADERAPRNCKAFFLCNKNKAQSGTCPKDFIFDVEKQMCNYPGLVVPECKDETDMTKIVCANMKNGLNVTDVSDCSKFYKCDAGVGTLDTCPVGLLFNHKTGGCDLPSNVDCGTVTCDGEKDVHKKDPKSCRIYYKCKTGSKVPEKVDCLRKMVGKSATDDELDCVEEIKSDCQNRCDGHNSKFGYAIDVENDKCFAYHPCKNNNMYFDQDDKPIRYKCADTYFFDMKSYKCKFMDGKTVNKDTCTLDATVP